jgi:type VI protein secretion system component VasK
VLSSLAGVLSTVVNVYTARDNVWSITAKIAVWVTGGCAGVSILLFALYNFWLLRGVRKRHNESFPEELRRKKKQKEHETLTEKVKRKAHEPALEPGSVV